MFRKLFFVKQSVFFITLSVRPQKTPASSSQSTPSKNSLINLPNSISSERRITTLLTFI